MSYFLSNFDLSSQKLSVTRCALWNNCVHTVTVVGDHKGKSINLWVFVSLHYDCVPIAAQCPSSFSIHWFLDSFLYSTCHNPHQHWQQWYDNSDITNAVWVIMKKILVWVETLTEDTFIEQQIIKLAYTYLTA